MNTSEYWKNRGDRYFSEFQNQPKYGLERFKKQEETVFRLIENMKFDSVLEIGCGFGRYTKILNTLFRPTKFIAIDLSKDQITKAKNYVNDTNVDFQCTKIQDFAPNQKFDLVFISEVLMHIDFKEIDKVIEKIISLSKCKIISIDWFNQKKIGNEFESYCFMHDYKKKFKQKNVRSVKIQMIPLPQVIKIINIYSKFRRRTGIGTQAIIEVDV